MEKSVLDDLTLDSIIEHISRGHAYNKHVLGEDTKEKMKGLNAFRARRDNFNKKLGPDLEIETVMDLRHYVEVFIDHPQTEGVVRPRDGSVILYNSAHNVIMCVSPNDGDHDYGSIFRYATSKQDYQAEHDDALYTEMSRSRHPYRKIDNFYPGSVRAALEDHIAGIQAEPEKYTAKPTTQPEHARFLVALGNENRPGRRDVQGAGNNGILHSVEYAETHQRNIFGPPNVNRPGVVVALDDYRSVDEGFELANLLKEKLDIGDDMDGYAEPRMM